MITKILNIIGILELQIKQANKRKSTMNTLVRLLEQYGYLSPLCKVALEENTQIFFKRKGDFLLQKGHQSDSLYVIEEGAIRGYYLYDGREIDVWYAFEHSILGATYQMYKSKPSLEYVQCIEDCIVYAIPNQVLLRFYREYPELNMIARRFTEDYCMLLEERAYQLQLMSPVQRYCRLLRKLQEDIERLSEKNIASYLGIREEQLSEIRRI